MRNDKANYCLVAAIGKNEWDNRSELVIPIDSRGRSNAPNTLIDSTNRESSDSNRTATTKGSNNNISRAVRGRRETNENKQQLSYMKATVSLGQFQDKNTFPSGRI